MSAYDNASLRKSFVKEYRDSNGKLSVEKWREFAERAIGDEVQDVDDAIEKNPASICTTSGQFMRSVDVVPGKKNVYITFDTRKNAEEYDHYLGRLAEIVGSLQFSITEKEDPPASSSLHPETHTAASYPSDEEEEEEESPFKSSVEVDQSGLPVKVWMPIADFIVASYAECQYQRHQRKKTGADRLFEHAPNLIESLEEIKKELGEIKERLDFGNPTEGVKRTRSSEHHKRPQHPRSKEQDEWGSGTVELLKPGTLSIRGRKPGGRGSGY